ncbi:MAG: hypothetical protein JNM94_09525 [Phycisphaerae bacterium]|nr:hypothetical protein [Phycisphaerae bacterium]
MRTHSSFPPTVALHAPLPSLACDVRIDVHEHTTTAVGAADPGAAWRAAQEFELADRLNAAEETLLGAIAEPGASCQVAHLYECRMMRLAKAGDRGNAEMAHAASVRWMWRSVEKARSVDALPLAIAARAHERRLAEVAKRWDRSRDAADTAC